MAKKHTDVVNENLPKEKAIPMEEIGGKQAIEKMAETDVVKLDDIAAQEAFANEILTIQIHESDKEGALDIINPSVNGTNMPMLRGKPIEVKRKYVEALARSRSTSYTQRMPGQMEDQSKIRMVDRTVMTYPFSVLHDPNPRGRDWLVEIMNQRV